MDQPFQRKKAASREETTTIRHTLLSPTEGKTTVKVSVILSNINLSYSFLLRYYIDFNTRWLSGVVRSCQELSGYIGKASRFHSPLLTWLRCNGNWVCCHFAFFKMSPSWLCTCQCDTRKTNNVKAAMEGPTPPTHGSSMEQENAADGIMLV